MFSELPKLKLKVYNSKFKTSESILLNSKWPKYANMI